MKIPLNSFEQYIDETILKRGFQYFKKGLVHEPEELMHGEYEGLTTNRTVCTAAEVNENNV